MVAASKRNGNRMNTDTNKPSKPPRLVLASASPRRREMLETHGYTFEVVIPPLNEPAELAGNPTAARTAEALSFYKARSVAEHMEHGIVLAADTVVALEGRLFGKPVDRDDARRIIGILAGTAHNVITGVTLLDAASNCRAIESDTTVVVMKPLSDGQIETYLDTLGWHGKAGAYGIQDQGDTFIDRFDGSFSNVVGLPMNLTIRLLSAWGIEPTGKNAG